MDHLALSQPVTMEGDVLSKFSQTLLERIGASAPAQRFRVIVQFANDASREDIATVDATLEHHGGRRLSEVNLLHTALVEANPKGLEALSQLGSVDSIFDNQKLKQLDSEARIR